jgi:hypothetical protein
MEENFEEKILPLSDRLRAMGATLQKPRKILETPTIDLDGLFSELRKACRRRKTITAKKLALAIIGVSKCTSEMLAEFTLRRPRKPSYDAVARIFYREICDCAATNPGPSVPTLLLLAANSPLDRACDQKADWWWNNALRRRFEAMSPQCRDQVMATYRIRIARLAVASKAFARYLADSRS